MFNKILIANRGASAEGAVAPATNCAVNGVAGHAAEFPAETQHV
jgi:acetyl/propionyl-CoA carboxylase alpha subunit